MHERIEKGEPATLKQAAPPHALMVGAEYWLTLVAGASPNAGRLAMFIACGRAADSGLARFR
jgi:hypothetical protein